MAGIFDTGIFDTGIFDHDAGGGSPPPPPPPPPAVGGGVGGWRKRYWKAVASRVSDEDVSRILRKLRGEGRKKKRRPTILRMAQVVREQAERAPETIPPDARATLAAMGVLDPPAMLDQAAYAKALKRERDMVEAAYLAVMEEREAAKAELAAIEADDAEVLALYAERRRQIAGQVLKLLQAKRET